MSVRLRRNCFEARRRARAQEPAGEEQAHENFVGTWRRCCCSFGVRFKRRHLFQPRSGQLDRCYTARPPQHFERRYLHVLGRGRVLESGIVRMSSGQRDIRNDARGDRRLKWWRMSAGGKLCVRFRTQQQCPGLRLHGDSDSAVQPMTDSGLPTRVHRADTGAHEEHKWRDRWQETARMDCNSRRTSPRFSRAIPRIDRASPGRDNAAMARG